MSPGRPRLFDEASVLEAAMMLFWQQGYAGTTMADLRRATGLSSASLYQAFGSKSGLFQSAVAHYVSRPGSVVSLTYDVGRPPREALAHLLHRTVDEQLDPSHPPGCLIALAATVGPSAGDQQPQTELMAKQRQVDRQHIGALVERGLSDAVGRAAAIAIATLVHSFILGLATQVRDGCNAQDLHAAADAILWSWDAMVAPAHA